MSAIKHLALNAAVSAAFTIISILLAWGVVVALT